MAARVGAGVPYSPVMQRAFAQICTVGLRTLSSRLDRGTGGRRRPTHRSLTSLPDCAGIVILAPSPAARGYAAHGVRTTSIAIPPSWACVRAVARAQDSAIAGASPAPRGWLCSSRRLCGGRQAADILEAEGISSEVINARFVKPLDEQRIRTAASKCGRMVVLEENSVVGGFGSAVLEVLSESVPGCRVARVGVPDRFIDHDKPEAQKEQAGLTGPQVAARQELYPLQGEGSPLWRHAPRRRSGPVSPGRCRAACSQARQEYLFIRPTLTSLRCCLRLDTGAALQPPSGLLLA